VSEGLSAEKPQEPSFPYLQGRCGGLPNSMSVAEELAEAGAADQRDWVLKML
jgi:hypothetical protein